MAQRNYWLILIILLIYIICFMGLFHRKINIQDHTKWTRRKFPNVNIYQTVIFRKFDSKALPLKFDSKPFPLDFYVDSSAPFLYQSPNLSLCPIEPPNLVGPIEVLLSAPSFKKIRQIYPELKAGGHGQPKNCLALHKVAIIVPYRDRESHLRIFLHNLHSILQKQQIDYAIFVVEQTSNQTFNRAKLMNVGFVEANKLYDWECYIFHDVDLLPENDRNMYSCPENPRHMSVAIDKFSYTLLYEAIFGGIVALTKEQYLKMNGFSNDYWGEDDDLYTRVFSAGFNISRYSSKIARYKMIKHHREDSNSANDCRHTLLGLTKSRYENDGFSNLNYTLLSVKKTPTYTEIKVDLLEEISKEAVKSNEKLKSCYNSSTF